MAESVWYYATNNVQHGPFTFEEMKAFAQEGRFSRTDLVWEPGFGNRWRNAGGVEDLFPDAVDNVNELPPDIPPTPEPALDRLMESAHNRVPLSGVKGEVPSVFGSAVLAFRRMRDVLFVSCRFTRWLGIAFCTWLCGFNFSLRLPNPAKSDLGIGSVAHSGGQSPDAVFKELQQMFNTAYDTAMQHLHTRTGLIVLFCILCFFLVFTLISFFLRCRGEFMFLHRWYHPDESIQTVWRNSRYAAHHLFRWEVGFYFLSLIVLGLTLVYGYRNILQPYLANGKAWDVKFVIPFIWFASFLSVELLTYAAVRSVIREFIVPVMYWQGCPANAAWRSFFSLCWQRPFRLLGYYLLMYVLFLVWFFVYLLAIVGSLFIGGILLALPYVGTVLLLPATFFFRGYSLAFIHQWRKDLVPLE
ncbi:MAG: DUF4339 domain-containing protein [Kiritimatiellae bacterium]|nr:DUF4339 domain-containing protein [Kiritimatiellia bacterium]